MRSLNMPASSRPLALTVAATLIATLAACADDPIAPINPTPGAPRASAQPLAGDGLFTVTNTNGGNAVGSLRWAVNQLATTNGGMIVFDPSLAGATIVLDQELELQGSTYIEGPATGITISGNDQHRVILTVFPTMLRNVTITGGNADLGSAIYAASSLNLKNTTIQGNRGGSAIYADHNWTDISNTTISGNTVTTGAIQYTGATVNLYHTTVANNAPGAGLALNSVASDEFVRVKLYNTIVANNGSPLRNCTSTFGLVYEGTNISSDWSCGEVGITIADPKLMALASNGGPNKTHAIPHASPAYNTGTECWAGFTDQRYVARDAKCDVGAFEFNDFTKVTLTIDAAPKLDATGKALLTGTVKCTRTDTFRLALELHQDQKVGNQVVDIHSARDIAVACTTTAKAWSATMALAPGEAFKAGAAHATAQTFNTPEWVTPAGAAASVKLRK